MNIIHVIETLNLSYGGPPKSTHGLCKALASMGHKVVIVARGSEGWCINDLNIKYSNGGELITVNLKYNSSFLMKAKEVLRDADIVHFQSVWSPINTILASWCYTRRIPYLYAPRGELDVWSMKQKRLKKKIYLKLFGATSINRASAMHFLNEKEVLGAKKQLLHAKYFVLPNGIDPDEWKALPEKGTFRSTVPEINGKIIISFMARFHHKKGVFLLAKAFVDLANDFPDTFLALAGPDQGEKKKVMTFLNKSGLHGRYKIYDMLQGEQRSAFMVDSDIFVAPSHQEGHPRNVMEAAYLGKCLLITKECHCEELANGVSAEVVIDTVDGVREGLKRLLLDPRYRETLAANAQIVAKKEYAWLEIAKKISYYYEKIVDGNTSFAEL